ncbi:MAG: ABC transporter ATP-binding protein [Coriobacteriales bacterium]|jgi:iron complex transport system ATP-binding protein|nr:ABC transporter ATP-binding protein [Coriobacteriales bacterium]
MKIALRDVAIGYDRNRPLQQYVSFAVESGEVCCVLGPNGCGKTTLIRTILGLTPLLGGTITIDGDNVTKWSASRLSDTMAYVVQKHDQPFPFQVKDVVMMGRINKVATLGGQPGREDYHIVKNAMQDMDIYHLRDAPSGDISDGELPTVMFARALAQEPQMMILDEPTASLDYGNAVRVIEKVRQLAERGLAVMMITHNPDHAFMTSAKVALFMRH